MDIKKMIDGGKMGLMLVLFIVGVLVTLLINQTVGLFIGGSLEQAATVANFSTEVDAAFTTVIGDFITNLTGLNTSVQFFIGLVIVIMVLAVFAVFIMRSKGDKGSGSDLGY
jgi:hypothetical protein